MEIIFERFGFYTMLVGDVLDADFGKIGLTRNRTQRGEILTVELNQIIAVLILIFKGFECGFFGCLRVIDGFAEMLKFHF